MKNGDLKCECGEQLRGKPTIFMPTVGAKEICPKCGKIQYIDYAPTDWDKVAKPMYVVVEK